MVAAELALLAASELLACELLDGLLDNDELASLEGELLLMARLELLEEMAAELLEGLELPPPLPPQAVNPSDTSVSNNRR